MKTSREIIKEVKCLSGIADKDLLKRAVAKLAIEPRLLYGSADWQLYVQEGHGIDYLVTELKKYADETSGKTSNQLEMNRRLKSQR